MTDEEQILHGLEDDEEPVGGTYEGETRHGLRHGQGRYLYANPYFSFEGSWKKGIKHGKGKFVLGDGSVYEGDFALGEIEGYGTRTWPSGASYSGQFHLGEMHGDGSRIDPDGAQYDGSFAENQRHGHGKLMMADGSIYEGDFVRNQQTGQGTLTTSEGETLGEFLEGEKHGQGSQRWADGSTYAGMWAHSRFHGKGTFRGRSRSYRGAWSSGTPASLASSLEVARIELPEPVVPQAGEYQLSAPTAALALPKSAALPKNAASAGSRATSRRSSSVTAPAASSAEDKPGVVPLVLSGPGPKLHLKCIDEREQVASAESGRRIRATLRRYAVSDVVVVDKKEKGAKKGKAEIASAPAAAPELVGEFIIGEALTSDGLVTFRQLALPSDVVPSTSDREYELTFTDETDDSSDDVLPPWAVLQSLRLPCTVAPGAAPAIV